MSDENCDMCQKEKATHEGLCEPCAIENWDAQQENMVGYRDKDELMNQQVKYQGLK